MLGNKQNEVTTECKEKMLLVLEKNELSTEDVTVSSSILETYLKLL
jgi:hypothetical protein